MTISSPDDHEQGYIAGSRAANAKLLAHALTELGYSSPEWTEKRWLIEREATLATLRRLCAEYGDNDWPDDLCLTDIIEKHLEPHLT